MLYQTFGEQTHWGKLMGINYVSDLNRKIEDGKIKDLIQLSEALHERKIIEIADMIIKKKQEDRFDRWTIVVRQDDFCSAAVHPAESERTGPAVYGDRRLFC